uniref:TPR_REGION domain-containing protein n=1 Tax=Ganoderma boninense TaxID=34458 RepID=A0A5K1JXD4_9APHY|nr:TPR_REGION domain-containing protein [Ganoderma boninense]
MIGALPHLLHLDIEHCWSRSYGASPIPDIDAPKLRSLSLVNYASLNIATATVFEACLEYPAAFSKLRILDIRLPGGYADPFDRFLQTVGPSLRELTIGVRPDAVLMRPLTLANCCGLRLLNFELKLKRPTRGEDHLLWLAPLLDSVQAPKLRRVKFVFRAQNANLKDWEAFDWNNISHILDNPRFTSVREVLFYVTHCDLPETTVASLIHKRLGALGHRGLRVTQRM